jgi:glycine hydroxymethyltransferase
VCFEEAAQPEFRNYARRVVENAAVMGETLAAAGLRLMTGGTDNHLLLVDVSTVGVTGKDAETALDRAGITVNKNAIPFDTQKPAVTSGIRVGTPASTTRGMGPEEMRQIGQWIAEIVRRPDDERLTARIRPEVRKLASQFPVPGC